MYERHASARTCPSSSRTRSTTYVRTQTNLFARTGGLAVFVAMAVAAAVALGVIVVGAALVLQRIPSTSPRDDEVLPSHYASLV